MLVQVRGGWKRPRPFCWYNLSRDAGERCTVQVLGWRRPQVVHTADPSLHLTSLHWTSDMAPIQRCLDTVQAAAPAGGRFDPILGDSWVGSSLVISLLSVPQVWEPTLETSFPWHSWVQKLLLPEHEVAGGKVGPKVRGGLDTQCSPSKQGYHTQLSNLQPPGTLYAWSDIRLPMYIGLAQRKCMLVIIRLKYRNILPGA